MRDDGPWLLLAPHGHPGRGRCARRRGAAGGRRAGRARARRGGRTRLNRRKIDLLPEPAWADPPKARIAELVAEATRRLTPPGTEACGTSWRSPPPPRWSRTARPSGHERRQARGDRSHRQVGCDAGAARELVAVGVGPGLLLVAGDEFGPLGGARGSDSYARARGSSRHRRLGGHRARRRTGRRPAPRRGSRELPEAAGRQARGVTPAPRAPGGPRPGVDGRRGRHGPAAPPRHRDAVHHRSRRAGRPRLARGGGVRALAARRGGLPPARPASSSCCPGPSWTQLDQRATTAQDVRVLDLRTGRTRPRGGAATARRCARCASRARGPA